MTPVAKQSNVCNSGAKKISIHDGGTFTHVPPSGYAPDYGGHVNTGMAN